VLDLDLAKPRQDRTRWPAQWRDHDISSGADALTVLAERAGESLPQTYIVATPSGGRHLYFTAPEEASVRNSAGRPGPMIDVRGQGGYVVAAGSRLHQRLDQDDDVAETNDHAYRLVQDLKPVTLPSWLVGITTADRQRDDRAVADLGARRDWDQSLSAPSNRYGAAALRVESDRVRSAPVGQRNHTLNSAAYSLGQLVAAGALQQDRVVVALASAAEAAGLEPSEIAATIASGLSAGTMRPRALPQSRNRTTNIGLEVEH
jgi:hypothetical protein